MDRGFVNEVYSSTHAVTTHASCPRHTAHGGSLRSQLVNIRANNLTNKRRNQSRFPPVSLLYGLGSGDEAGGRRGVVYVAVAILDWPSPLLLLLPSDAGGARHVVRGSRQGRACLDDG